MLGLLALVAGQDVEPADTDGTWRMAQQVAPGRVVSTVDPVSGLRQGGHHQAIKPCPCAPPWPAVSTGTTSSSTTTRAPPPVPPATASPFPPRALPPSGSFAGPARCGGRCTTAKGGRSLNIGPHDSEPVEARRAWRAGDFVATYRQFRPMVERSIASHVADNHHRVGYRGVERAVRLR